MRSPNDPALLEPARVARVLAELGLLRQARRDLVEAIAACAAKVEERAGEPVPTWSVGDQIVRRARGATRLSEGWSCSCGGRACAHQTAVMLVLALAEPRLRWILSAPDWELALSDLAEPDAPPAPPGAHVRYDIDPPTPGHPGLGVRPSIVREGRAPQRYPRELVGLRALVHPDEADLDAHAAWHALERARHLERTGPSTTTRQLSRALLEPLSRAKDVRFDGKPVRVSPEPLRPHVVAQRSPTGLTLAWEPPVAIRWEDIGVVLTAAGELRPLAADLPEAVALRVGDPLPDVPEEQIERFVDRIVVDRGLDVALPDGIGRVRDPDDRAARLVLGEDGATLVVRLDLVYFRGDAEVAVGETVEGLARVPGAGVVRRDHGWEAVARDRFLRDLGAPSPLRLTGDLALDFLSRKLHGLRERWPVYGEDGLVRHRLVGALTPSIGFASGEDWFDLDVRFEVKGKKLPARPVIASWLRGDRYLRLDDGSVAELPARWLERHGQAVDLLDSARRAQKRLSSWHAWEASELLREQGAERWLGWIDALRDGIPTRPPPAGLQAELRPYQQRGYEWLCFLRDHGLHGVLADDMGLGKTVQALAAVLDTPSAHPALVVAPTSVLHGWMDEAARFAPSLRVKAHHGPGRGDLDADLVITTYGTLRRDAERLASQRWSWAILDEGQQIKNPASGIARAACSLRADHRLVLTGTPLENHLTDLWSLFRFLQPGLLGTRRAFHGRYAGPAARDGRAAGIDELRKRVRPFVLRRLKSEVAPELPARSEVLLRVELSAGERDLYDGLLETVRQSLAGALQGGEQVRRIDVLAALTRLRQACCDPSLLPFPEARRVRRSAKLEALRETLGEAIAGGHRCLVFSQWPSLLYRVRDQLDADGIGHLLLEGATVDRASLVRRFQAPDGPPVFLISTKAGGTGLNLTAADIVFHLDPWWNPAVDDQATDRAHRIGQLRPVTVYKLVAAGTVEEKVLALQQRKRDLFARTIDEVDTLPFDDLVSVLRSEC